jgi:hypothetical protein
LSRVPNVPAGERAFSPTHLRRAVYAHLNVLTNVVAEQMQGRFPLESLANASGAVTSCLAQMLVAEDDSPERYWALMRPLTTLFTVERALIGAAMLGLSDEELLRMGTLAEDQFEVLYGRGELAAERGASQMGAL